MKIADELWLHCSAEGLPSAEPKNVRVVFVFHRDGL